MKLARFWTRAQAEATSAKGRRVIALARGWSDEGIEAARNRAVEIAQRVADRIAAGLTTKQRYPYGDRPLPEPVVRDFRAESNAAAIVTRNAYGALVLNTDQLMFVDVDRPQDPKTGPTLGKMMSSLFSKPKAEPSPPPDGMMEKIGAVIQRNRLSARVYETKAGYRVLITSAPFIAGSPEAEVLLEEFGSDPLYIRLCRLQECFRARLTPKPWRCNMTEPPVAFPFEAPTAQQRFDRWLAGYDERRESFATCSFIGAVGNGAVASSFAQLIEYHDEETKAASALRLA